MVAGKEDSVKGDDKSSEAGSEKSEEPPPKKKRKTVHWAPDKVLTHIKYFELDETERGRL